MNKTSNKNLLSYSLLAFCLAFIGLPIYIYLPNYYANNFNLDLKVIAGILFITRLVDTIQDPIFGIISDKFSYLKKKIILFTCPFLGISFLFLFYPLDFLSLNLWLIIFLILTYSFFSLIYINYQSYAVSLSKDYNVKTKIIAFREIFFITGIIFAASTPAILTNFFGEVRSFFFIGIGYFFLSILFGLIFYFYAPAFNKNLKLNFNLSKTFKNPQLRKFFLLFLFNSISASIPAVLILFFVETVLNAKHLTGLFLIIYFVGLLLGTLFWSRLSFKINNKVKSWLMAMFVTLFSFIWCYFLGEGDILFYALISLFSGFGFGADFCLGYSILTDIIQKNKLQNNETTIFSVCNFIIKISLTLASSILIYFIGYFEDYSLTYKQEFISFSYAILPVVIRIFSILILYKNFK